MAQTNTTGSIEGTVTDPNGAVVPNATITVNGQALLRPLTATSNSNGSFRVNQIPPGKYTVDISTSGFSAFKRENVEVNLNSTTTLAAELSLQANQTTVDVTAGTPDVDVTNNTSGTSIQSDFFSNIPTSRTVQGLYTIAPTVTRSGLRDASGRDRDPSVAGSSGPENNYILDGVNTTDPAFGGGGANLPFEFVQEVQIKTGSYGADQGLSTGGVFNVITKSGGNDFHGDVFGYFSNKKLVRATKNFPFTGSAPNGFSEFDGGADFSGPIIKNRLTFFAAINPQYRKNFTLTQTFRQPVENKIQTPFYSGKITYLINNSNTFTFSTFGDFTKQEGFLGGSGFGANVDSFRGTQETGGTNYAFRLNSSWGSKWIGEFSVGLHRQRNNVIPVSSVSSKSAITDNFAILTSAGAVAGVTQTNVLAGTNTVPTTPIPGTNTGFIDYVYAPGGSLQRGFVRDGFGIYQNQNRNREEAAARFQSIYGEHSFKYGFEFYRNKYVISQLSTGPSNVFANPLNVGPANGSNPSNVSVNGFRVTNNYSVCTTRTTQIVCPSSTAVAILTPLVAAGQLPTGITSVVLGSITTAEVNRNPFLVRTTTRVRDFELNANTHTDVEGFYVQDDWKVTKNLQLNFGVRWDLQQAYGNQGQTYLKLNNLFDDLQPRVGFIWDFLNNGKSKFFANYARYVETPLPLDINVRAGSQESQTDKNFNVNRVNAPLSSTVATGFGTRNLGAEPTPIDGGLKPQTVNEFTLGVEMEVRKNYTFGVRGIYRPQGSVIEDGSFDDGNNYFLFNPGEALPPGARNNAAGNTEYQACNEPTIGCFGRARRYYRALEFTLNRRFANNFSFVSSYVYSSLIGNYEGLFRNDNGQSDPNITSLFDLVSLLKNTYGRLPNDRPHQFKFNGNYQTPFKLVVSGNFYIQSGIPFNQLIPHPVYGNNEGFGVLRGTAIIPNVASSGVTNGNQGIASAIGKTRSPTTFNLDLGFYYPIKFGEKKELRFSADWFNVTNTQRAITLDQTFTINSGVTGVAPISNPFYGSGTIFQYPSSLRLGAKFTF